MTEKLTWQEIEERYDGQWVQLVDYEWNDEDLYPTYGVVQAHAPTRKEFNALVREQPPSGAARIYVGHMMHDPNAVICCNLHRIVPSRADANK